MQLAFGHLISNQTHLFVTDVTKEEMLEAYLSNFSPEDRQEHDCNACKSFISHYGNIVALVNGKVTSIWDFPIGDQYEKSIKVLNELVSSRAIKDVFFTKWRALGVDHNVQIPTKGPSKTWNHFSLDIPSRFVNTSSLSVEALRGNYRDNRNVFVRALEEFTAETVDTVLDLIAQGSLYKGDEFKGALLEFSKLQKTYTETSDKDSYAWIAAAQIPSSIAKIRNSAVGTLLKHIVEGKDLDWAVTAFEKVVAPTNYKRPSAIVTPAMITAAEKELKSLDLIDSLQRRFAEPEDLSVENLLWVNRDVKKPAGIFDGLREDVIVNPKSYSKVDEISVKDFVEKVLPTTTSIEVLLESNHSSNFFSLITGEVPEAKGMFKWPNPFSWSYTNAVTDSIKEKVKAAGGNVVGEIRVSLSWYNHDDLDLHVIEPGGNIIYYGSKISLTSGNLDVDMNAGVAASRTPVENIIWTNKTKMKEGLYQVSVNQFSKRENIAVGYSVEIECQGQVYNFDFAESPSNTDLVAKFIYSEKDGITMQTEGTTSSSKVISKDKWGLGTNKFQKVSMVLNSPNYWGDSATGNKHLFFILDGAKSDEAPRGFFNEFLQDDLVNNHKRMFEVLAGRLKVIPAIKEVSGIGFSSTQRNSAIVRIDGTFKRTIKINF